MPLSLLSALSFLKAHLRGVAVVALVLGAFVGGRCSARKPTVTTVTVEKVQWKDRIVTQIVEKRVEVKAEKKNTIVYRDIVRHADGSTETKEEIKTVDAKTDRTSDDKTTARTEDKSGTKDITETKTVSYDAPKYVVTAGLGVPVGLKAPFIGTPFVMVAASKRFLGPLSLGVFGSLDVKGQNPALGLSVGMSF